MMRFACIKQMEIIGEASNHLSAELKSKFSEIEWAQIIGMRNVFTHEYFGIDSSLVWEIIKNDIPEMKGKIEHILKIISLPIHAVAIINFFNPTTVLSYL